jgi:hypothetical protein
MTENVTWMLSFLLLLGTGDGRNDKEIFSAREKIVRQSAIDKVPTF